MFFKQSDAAFGSLGTVSDDMKKNSTAVILNARALIVAGRDHHIISAIFTPQVFVAGFKRQGNAPIIGTVKFRVTPAINGFHRFGLDRCARFPQSIWPIVEFFKFPCAYWTCAITLALSIAAAGFAEQAGKCVVTNFQDTMA